jgi:Spy/CpxP family protein refolding chaperone
MRRVNVIAFSLIGAAFSIHSARAENAPPADDQATAELKEHHRHHHHGGVTQFIAMSLDTLGEDEAKRPQVEKIQSDLHACTAPAREGEKKVLSTIADGVASGTIDAAKVDAAIAQLNTAAGGVHDCSVNALNQLHALLSPTERAALVDKVQAHWGVWRHVNHEAAPGGREEGGRLSELAKELSLSADQVEKISASLHTTLAGLAGKFDHDKVRAHVQAFSTAFVGDTFDAKTIAGNANAHLAAHGATRMALFYETVTPLLTAEQRKTLADHLREHASHQPAVPGK